MILQYQFHAEENGFDTNSMHDLSKLFSTQRNISFDGCKQSEMKKNFVIEKSKRQIEPTVREHLRMIQCQFFYQFYIQIVPIAANCSCRYSI